MTNRQARLGLASTLALGAIILPAAPASAQVACPSLWQAAQSGTVAQRRQKLNTFLARCPRDPNAGEARRRLAALASPPSPPPTPTPPVVNPDALPNRGTLLPSGVRVEVVRQGNGVAVGPTDTVLLRYRLTRLNGQLVNENMQAPEPLRFTLRPDLRGFDDALANLRLGSIVNIWVPRALRATGPGVPPSANHPLAYLVEIAGVIPVGGPPPPVLTPAAIAMRDALAAVSVGEWLAQTDPFALDARIWRLGAHSDMRMLADAGDVRARFLVGRAYAWGEYGVAQDRAEALRWYRLAAEGGDGRAQNNLGISYLDGTDGTRDYALAERYLSQAAAQGSAAARRNLGLMYEEERGVARDYARAMTLYRQAAAQNFPRAFSDVGRLYQLGRGVPESAEEAVRWYREGASRNDPSAQTSLANMYQLGRGTSPDLERAVELLRQAALQGFAEAMSRLGEAYANQRGVTRDDAEAVRWYRQGAEGGSTGGMVGLGFMYEMGRGGLSRDDTQAVQWYRRAADGGNVVAINHLGVMYEGGRGGLPASYQEAMRRYRLAAEAGLVPAQANLGKLLYNGDADFPPNQTDGLIWLRRAAVAGDQSAILFLGNRGIPLVAPVSQAPVLPDGQGAPASAPAMGPFIVYFDWDQDAITPMAAATLDNVVTAWQQLGNSSARVNLAGHTDRESSAAYSMSMGQRRANNVRAYLSARGIPDAVISAQSFGESRPRVETPDGVPEPQNRRVEISFGPGG